jgi:hypothetical protein
LRQVPCRHRKRQAYDRAAEHHLSSALRHGSSMASSLRSPKIIAEGKGEMKPVRNASKKDVSNIIAYVPAMKK